jgi:hypothetical protein
VLTDDRQQARYLSISLWLVRSFFFFFFFFSSVTSALIECLFIKNFAAAQKQMTLTVFKDEQRLPYVKHCLLDLHEQNTRH